MSQDSQGQEAKKRTFTCRVTSPCPQDSKANYELLFGVLRAVSPGKKERGAGRTLASIRAARPLLGATLWRSHTNGCPL